VVAVGLNEKPLGANPFEVLKGDFVMDLKKNICFFFALIT
jgi:hypothetical protein